MKSSISIYGQTVLQNVFNEDEVESEFLLSKPSCFIVIGKPGSGKSTLAKSLSENWNCKWLQSTHVIKNEINEKSKVGLEMLDILMQGEMLTTEFVIQLLKDKLSSPEVRHYGYVLDDFPTISNEAVSLEEQITMIKDNTMKPDFVINIKIPDNDLVERKCGIKVDSETGTMFLKNVWMSDSQPAAEKNDLIQDEDEEEDFEEGSMTKIVEETVEFTKDVSERLVQLPEFQLDSTNKSIELYKTNLLKLLENYMGDHNRQYVIELDGNLPHKVLFEQLQIKLETYTAGHAIAPVVLLNSDEDELNEDMDDDDLLRTLSSHKMPGPFYRWRKSKWGRWCPVSLKDGNMIQGKPLFAASFLDKVYVMSSADALSLFMKNPRPFLLPPMPAIPCKLAILGPPLSGKTSLCKYFAERYKAAIFDISTLVSSKYEEEREKLVTKVKEETTKSAVIYVQGKLEKEFLYEMANKGSVSDDVGDEDEKESSINLSGELPVVTESNEEVCRMVEQAVAEAKEQEITLAPEIYADVLIDAINKMIDDRKLSNPDSPMNGGWILDGFPENRDQWKAMTDVGIIPDDYIALIDKTSSYEIICKRYFDLHPKDIIDQYRFRLISEKQVVLQEVEEEIEKIIDSFESKVAESDRELNEQGSEVRENSKDDMQVEDSVLKEDVEDVENVEDKKSVPIVTVFETDKYKEQDQKKNVLMEEIKELEQATLDMPHFKSPEFAAIRNTCQKFEKDFNNIQSNMSGVSSKIKFIGIQEKDLENAGKLIADNLDDVFGYHAYETGALDMDEEEEDMNAVVEAENGQIEDEEMIDAFREQQRLFGYTKNFDPVEFHENFCLWPGNSEIAAKYREKIYYFSSIENQETFIADPLKYLPHNKPFVPPPPRILLIGARGSGKTTQGRHFAKELQIFHVSFRERLQEFILLKLKRKVGPEYEDQRLLQKELAVGVDEAVLKATISSSDSGETETEEDDSELTKAKFNDEEEAIYGYLMDDEALPEEILDKVISPLWKEEPYRSTGFILEGFPRNSEECQFILQKGYFVDAALWLNIDENDVIDRIFPMRFQLWKDCRDLQLLKQQKIQERKKQIRDEKILARRLELINEQNELKSEGEEEEFDIEEVLLAEFEEESDDNDAEEEESEEDVVIRMKTEISDAFEADALKLQSIQEMLEEGLVPFFEINGKKKASLINKHIKAVLHPYIDCRQSLFERVYSINAKLAEKLLATGYKYSSSFAKWDPVKLYEGDLMCPLRGEDNPLYPVVYNQYVYFLSSVDSKDKFIADPLKYAYTNSIVKPVVPIQIAVVGPPKSGKTTLCKRFQKEYGTVILSCGNCIRKLLDTQPHTHLVKEIQNHLYKGQVVPDELAVEALAVVLLDTVCTTRGYTIDGYPCTGQQMTWMRKRGILPARFIELQIIAREMLHRNELNKASKIVWELPLHDSNDILAVRYSCYCEHTAPLQLYYKTHHHNWEVVDAKISKWKMWNTAYNIVMSSVKKIQDYLISIEKGDAAPITGLCISPKEFNLHLGAYGHYCPISLNMFNELIDCSADSYLNNAVEYRAKYYKLASSERAQIFLESPQYFVPPLAEVSLPPDHLLPKRRCQNDVKSLFPMQIQFGGYCPVNYFENNFRFEALTPGNPDLIVQYRNMLYQFTCEENLVSFMKTPEKYYSTKLPQKMPPKQAPMSLSNLPMLGYLEQGASHSIIRGLTDVGFYKPKFPYASIQKSCFVYLTFHFKAFNPRYSSYIRQKYLKKLREFQDMCDIIPYLGNNMTRKYRNYRPVEFDVKMNKFVSLQERQPSRYLTL